MPHDSTTVVDLRPDTSEDDDQSDEPSRPHPTPSAGGLPSFPGFLLVVLLGLGLLVGGLLLSATPPV